MQPETLYPLPDGQRTTFFVKHLILLGIGGLERMFPCFYLISLQRDIIMLQLWHKFEGRFISYADDYAYPRFAEYK